MISLGQMISIRNIKDLGIIQKLNLITVYELFY
jgi:hypothetical protein